MMLQSLYEGNISTFPVRFLANFFTQLLKTFRALTQVFVEIPQ